MQLEDSRFLSREGRLLPGWKRLLRVTPPAAGNDWSLTVPGGQMYRLLIGTALLNTSTTAGNRFFGFHILSPDGFVTYGVPNAQTFSTISSQSNHHYAISDSLTIITAGASALLPVPNMWLPEGWQYGSESFPLAGDTWASIQLLIETVNVTDEQLNTYIHELEHLTMGGH